MSFVTYLLAFLIDFCNTIPAPLRLTLPDYLIAEL